ncbi:MAG: hypothetical protein KBD37_00145 [Burkholderiales bacterium]|nr:hypothetical protein [Burkholderiales bacterium]
MQSSIILALMVLASLFMAAEFKRNDSGDANNIAVFKSDTVAANIMQYNDLMVQYILANYEVLHLPIAINSGSVEQIALLNYEANHVDSYSQKNLLLFLNYTSTTFNYANSLDGESEIIPTVYLATSWDNYTKDIMHNYSATSMLAIMGKLGQDLSKHLYQGNSTYWVVPWVFSQNNCEVEEIFSQLPTNSSGVADIAQLKHLFNTFCSKVQSNSEYKFLKYVYLQPVIKASDI